MTALHRLRLARTLGGKARYLGPATLVYRGQVYLPPTQGQPVAGASCFRSMEERPSYARELRSVLVASGSPEIRAAISRSSMERGLEVECSDSSEHARSVVQSSTPDLVIVHLTSFTRETGIEILKCSLEITPIPIAVLIGAHDPEQAFRASQLGARALVCEPFSLDQLWATVEEQAAHPPLLTPVIAASVGHIPLSAARSAVSAAMMRQALGLTENNRRGAARLLKVSRQAVQQVLRRQSQDHDGRGPSAGSDRDSNS